MIGILEYGNGIEVFAGRNVAQRVGGSDHAGAERAHGLHALDHLVAQTALEQDGGKRCRADVAQAVAAFGHAASDRLDGGFVHGNRSRFKFLRSCKIAGRQRD